MNKPILFIAGIGPGAEIIETKPLIAGDPDACLKLLKNLAPRALTKANEIETSHPTGLERVDDLIKSAMRSPAPIRSLEAGYAGRIALEADALSKSVGSDAEVLEGFEESGRKLIRLRHKQAA
jgi:hypothetical protein